MEIEKGEMGLFREMIGQVQRESGWQLKSDTSCCGVTVAQCHALMVIEKHGEISLADLAGALGLDRSTLSRTVDSMVLDGLVERRPDSRDRRFISICLTEKGRLVCDSINQTFNCYYRAVLNLIPEEKRRQVIESVALLAAALQEYNRQECCKENV